MNRAIFVSLVLLGAALSPIVRSPEDDSFPLSTYPMFAVERPLTQTIDYPLGVTATGARRTLTPAMIGTHQVLQAYVVIESAVRGRPAELAQLCGAIATRVAADDEFADVVAVRIVSGTHDAVAYLADGVIGHEVERARCRVPR